MKLYVILKNGEFYKGLNERPSTKTVKTYTTRGMAEGVIKKAIPVLATEEYRKIVRKLDIKPIVNSDLEKEVYKDIFKKLENEFVVKEIEV